MPSLDKKEVINNMMLFLAHTLNMRSKMDITPYELGQIKILIQSIEVMYIIGVRSGFKIKIDGHSVIHQQAEMEELKKLILPCSISPGGRHRFSPQRELWVEVIFYNSEPQRGDTT